MPIIKPVAPKPVTPTNVGATPTPPTQGAFRNREVRQAAIASGSLTRSRSPHDPLPPLPQERAVGLRNVRQTVAHAGSAQANTPRESLYMNTDEAKAAARLQGQQAPTYVNARQAQHGTPGGTSGATYQNVGIPDEGEYIEMSSGVQEPEYAQANEAAGQGDPIYEDPEKVMSGMDARRTQDGTQEAVYQNTGAADEGEYTEMSAGVQESEYMQMDEVAGQGAPDEGEYTEMSAGVQEPEYEQVGEAAGQGAPIYEDPDKAMSGADARRVQDGTQEAVYQNTGAADEGEYTEMSAGVQESEYMQMDEVAGQSAPDEGEYTEMSAGVQEPEYEQVGEAAGQGAPIYEDPDKAMSGADARRAQDGIEEAVYQNTGAADEGEYTEMSAGVDEPEYMQMDGVAGQGAPDEGEYTEMSSVPQEPEYEQVGGAAGQGTPIYEDPDQAASGADARRAQGGTQEAVYQNTGAADEGEYTEMSAGVQEPEYTEMSSVPQEPEYEQVGGAAGQGTPIYEDPDQAASGADARRAQGGAQEAVYQNTGAADEGEYTEMSAGVQEPEYTEMSSVPQEPEYEQVGEGAGQGTPIYEDPDQAASGADARRAQGGTQEAVYQNTGAADEGEYTEMSAGVQEPEYTEMSPGVEEPEYEQVGEAAGQGTPIYEDPDQAASGADARRAQGGTQEAVYQNTGAADEGEYTEMSAGVQEPEYTEMSPGVEEPEYEQVGGAAGQGTPIYEDPDQAASGADARRTQGGTQEAVYQNTGVADEGEYTEMSAGVDEPEYTEMSSVPQEPEYEQVGGAAGQGTPIYEDPDQAASGADARRTQGGAQEAVYQNTGAADGGEYTEMSAGVDEPEYTEMSSVPQEPEYEQVGGAAGQGTPIYEDPDQAASGADARRTQGGTQEAVYQNTGAADEGEYTEMSSVPQEPEYEQVGEAAGQDAPIYEDPDKVASGREN